MALKQYEKAVLAYNKVIKDYPEGNKVPSAMYREAMAFLEIKDEESGKADVTSAKIILKDIIKKYPGSNEAELAQKNVRLNGMEDRIQLTDMSFLWRYADIMATV